MIELLGAGSTGRVYRARDTGLVREVALKQIDPGRWNVMTAQMLLHREARAMARVEHAAVIRIYDAPIVAGELFVAMELARGGTLVAWMKARPRRWREVVQVFLEAGRGLAAAHQVGLVHRDIKPSNILLDAHGRAKIGDFGLARMFGAAEASDGDAKEPAAASFDVSLTRTGAIAGTLPYMAPEQLSGGPVDARADQFSFCVALWEALCGRRPFWVSLDAGRAAEAFLQAIAAGSLEGPRDDLRVPRRILALVRRGLAADRARRWGSMDELLDALARAARPRRMWWIGPAAFVLGLSVVTSAVRSPEHAVPARCGKRDQIAAVWNSEVRARYLSGGVNPAALEDAGWFDRYARELEAAYTASCTGAPQRIGCLDDAVEDLRIAIARTERTYWPRLRAIDRCGAAMREQVVGEFVAGDFALLSPDGRQLAMSDRTHRTSTIIRELGSSRSRPLDLALALKWLRGGSIVGVDDHGRITVVDPAAHRTIRTFDTAGNLFDVSSDLSRVARWADGELSIVPLAGGAPIIAPVAVAEWGKGRFSPDGRRFAMLSGYENSMLYIDDLVSKHREALALRVHWHNTGVIDVSWLDPTSLVVSGSATNEIAGDLWRVRVDATGRLAAPPQILRRAERDTALVPKDAQAGKLLIMRIRIAMQNISLDGESTAPLPDSASRVRPVAADGAHRRVLGAIDASETRWAWMSLDGSSVEPIAALDGLHDAVARSSGLSALDLRSELPVYIAFDEAGVEVMRVPIEAARGASPTLRCGVSRCVVKWATGDVAFVATIEGRTVGAPIRPEQPLLAFPRAFWEIAPDGKRIAFATLPYSNTLELYDLEHTVMRHVTSVACEEVQHAWFLPDGGFVLSGTRRLDAGYEFVLVRRDATGQEHVLWRGDAWISGGVPLDDHRMITSTVSRQWSLEMLEMQ
ncbi:MAG TPA: serine/threonine-protein kinase [Kofleriaceae bacterium]|nr:serine/threonine-protein kinase [Kofleriaceae bacterium]